MERKRSGGLRSGNGAESEGSRNAWSEERLFLPLTLRSRSAHMLCSHCFGWSKCWARLLGWYTIIVSPTTSLVLWPAFIGSEYMSASRIRLRCWRSVFYEVRRLNTCHRNWCALLTFHLVTGCGLWLHPSWWCQLVGFLLSAVAHSLLLVF